MAAVPRSASEHPATWKFDMPIFHAESRAAWRAWLQANHGSERGVWLCSWRGSTGRPVCPYPEAVEEAICFGWIDSTVSVLDEERALQLMTPRKPKSSWTRLNRRRVAAMEEAGLMAEAGRRAVEVARQNGWWTIYDPVGPRRARRPGRRAGCEPGGPGPVGRLPAQRPEDDAVVGHQRRSGGHPAAAHRRRGRESCSGPAGPWLTRWGPVIFRASQASVVP
ncbi:MAG TPA: hypothetical protein VEW93_02530 [Acidimicrobiales bacterium]|nr:hypothetical protein [Acidimicrobiales bacterium]